MTAVYMASPSYGWGNPHRNQGIDLPGEFSMGGGTPHRIMSPRHGNSNMNMSMDKPIVLNRAEVTRGPQVENAKINEKRCSEGMGIRI